MLVWLVAAVLLVVLAQRAGENTNDNLSLPGTGSDEATSLLQQRFPDRANPAVPLLLHAPSGTLEDPKYASAIAATTAAYAKNAHVVAAVSPLTPQGAGFLSKDRTIGYISLTLRDSPSQLSIDESHALYDLAAPAREAGLQAEAGGYLGQKLSKPSTESSEAVGLTMAVIVLLATFGTAVLMGIPIVTAILGLAVALSTITLLGHVTDVPRISPTLATMIGLGVGIDYALFLLTRHSQQVGEGMDVEESIARSVASDGGAIVFAGTTVVIAICSLALAQIPLVSVLGYTAALAVLTAVIAAITLLPAILGILGRNIERLALPWHGRVPPPPETTKWAGFGRAVVRRPWVAVIVALAILIPLSLPTLSLTLGQQDVGELPTSTTARQAYDLLAQGFGPGAPGPLLIAVDLGDQAATGPDDARLTKLEAAIAKAPDVASVSPATLNGDRTVAILNAVSRSSPSDDATSDLVRDLRNDTLPAALAGTSVQAFIGGTTASYVDLATRIADKLPLVIFIVIALSFLVLTLAFRSLVIPAKAAVMNLLSVTAAYGVLTLIFQHGHGASLVGLDHGVAIVSFVPLMMFAVLFGLSMDYEVFLMSHVQEAYKKSGDNAHAVVMGLATSGKVITSAALIMVSVFASFVLNGDPTVKQFGVGLAVAVALDATVVRCLLVPALMVLMQRANWWLPHWLDRALPRVDIEGVEYFAEHDAPASDPRVTS